MSALRRPLATATAALLLALSLAACGGGDDDNEGSDDPSQTESSASDDAGDATDDDATDATDDGDDSGEGDAPPAVAGNEEFCGGLEDIITATTAVQGEQPTEEEWEAIQEAYGDLGEIGAPADIGEREREGFEVIVEAVTELDYDEALKAFGDADGSDAIPGVSEEDNAKAEEFFVYASQACADLGATPSQ